MEIGQRDPRSGAAIAVVVMTMVVMTVVLMNTVLMNTVLITHSAWLLALLVFCLGCQVYLFTRRTRPSTQRAAGPDLEVYQ